jgi:hypothetical protein
MNAPLFDIFLFSIRMGEWQCRLNAWVRRGPMLIYVCCVLLSINKYYTILTNKYLSLKNEYFSCAMLKIMNNMHFYFKNFMITMMVLRRLWCMVSSWVLVYSICLSDWMFHYCILENFSCPPDWMVFLCLYFIVYKVESIVCEYIPFSKDF